VSTILVYFEVFRASRVGQALFAFARVALATLAACWLDGGLPVRDLTGTMVLDWVELAIQAGGALVLVNALGPWETRYGRKGPKTLSRGDNGPA
jgi:hypothetical protein